MNSLSLTCLFCAPLHPTKPCLDIKRCHRRCSVTVQGQRAGEVCRSERGHAGEDFQNDVISVSASACQTQQVLICAIMVVLSRWGVTGWALFVEDNVWEETPENRLDMGLRDTESSLLCLPAEST